MADADSDGAHIATLICALFVKHFPKLVKEGHVYVAMPPLYRIDAGKQVFYALDNKEKNAIEKRLVKENKRQKLQVSEGKVWMIGDSAENDIYGAKKNFNMTTLQKIHSGVTIGEGKLEPDVSFDNYQELNNLIMRLTKSD